MGSSGHKQCREGNYRPQRPKAGRRNYVQKEMVSDRSGGIVDRVKQMMAGSRGQGIGPGRLCRVLESGQEGKASTADDCQKEVVSEVNDVQPCKGRQERKGVKRSLFGDVEKRSCVNRELRDQLVEKKMSLKSGRSKHLHRDPSSTIHHQRKKNTVYKEKVFSKSNISPDKTSESNMYSIINTKIMTSSSYSHDLPSSSHYSVTNLPIISTYSEDLPSMSSYTTDLPSIPSYSTILVPPPSLPYPSSTDLPSPLNLSQPSSGNHQNRCTTLTSSPGQSGGFSFSSSPVLKPQQHYDCFPARTISSFSLFLPSLSEGPFHTHIASPSQTSFSSDHSVQLNFSSSSSDLVDDGWCWEEDSSQLSLGDVGGDRQLVDRVRWEKGEL